MQVYFLTGTGTDVGKTKVALCMMAHWIKNDLSVAGIKPIACGGIDTEYGFRNQDAILHQRQSSIDIEYEMINPIIFRSPISPNIAAQREGCVITLTQLLNHFSLVKKLPVQRVVMEGAGGWMVPLSDGMTMADYVHALQIPVIVVVDVTVGCINHALLTARTLQMSNTPCMGWIANHTRHICKADSDAMIQTIRSYLDCPLLGMIEFMADFGIWYDTAGCIMNQACANVK